MTSKIVMFNTKKVVLFRIVSGIAVAAILMAIPGGSFDFREIAFWRCIFTTIFADLITVYLLKKYQVNKPHEKADK